MTNVSKIFLGGSIMSCYDNITSVNFLTFHSILKAEKWHIFVLLFISITAIVFIPIFNCIKNKKRTTIWKIFLPICIVISAIATNFLILVGTFYYFTKKQIAVITNSEVSGDFQYKVIMNETNREELSDESESAADSDMYVCITGLSDLGKSKEIIIIPQYINGIKVKKIGTITGGDFESEVLKRIYVPCEIEWCMISSDNFNHPLLERVIFISVHTPKTPMLVSHWYINSYNHDEEDILNNGSNHTFFCNVSYMYNYEGSPNQGYYWVDDYDYGEIIKYVPTNPNRTGYIFGGWYKEKECLNKWDFGVDLLPEPIYIDDNSDVTIYQETVLFAKWIKVE